MLLLLLGLFLLTTVLTGSIRSYALRHSVLDIPNQRSSHIVPTPRGGGVAFVIGFLICTLIFYFYNYIDIQTLLCFFGTGLLIAVVGFIDDHAPLSPAWRLLGQIIASVFALFLLKGMPPIPFGYYLLPAASVGGGVLAVLYLMWMINLYNFMDGIDGLAAVEAIFVCCAAAFIYWLQSGYEMMVLPLALAVSVSRFLCWNFPRAKIFMGDSGSGFLGVTLAILSIQGAWVDPNYLWSWLILLGVFIVDATLTLLWRAMSGKRIYEAHRSHAYQNATGFFQSHFFVTMLVLFLNLLWLLPLATLVGRGYLNGLLGLIIAYTPLFVLALQFQAGKSL